MTVFVLVVLVGTQFTFCGFLTCPVKQVTHYTFTTNVDVGCEQYILHPRGVHRRHRRVFGPRRCTEQFIGSANGVKDFRFKI